VHYDCTTGIEAKLAGKPVIAYTPLKIEKIAAWLPIYISEEAQDENELVALLEKYLMDGYQQEFSEDKRKLLKQYIENIDVESSKTITKKVLAIVHNDIDHVNVLKKGINFSNYILRFYTRFYSLLKIIRSKYLRKSGYYDRFPGIKKNEIKKKLDLLMKIEGFDIGKIKIKKCGADTFKIIANPVQRS